MNLKKIFHDKWFVLAIFVVVFVFLWFVIRPTYIVSSCQNKARQAGVEWWSLEFTQTLETLRKSQLQTEYTEDFYTRCIHDRGLDK